MRRRGLPVLSKRRFYDYITELKERGFIDVVRRGKGYMDELVEDFVVIVTSFAARIYGKRSQKFRKIKTS